MQHSDTRQHQLDAPETLPAAGHVTVPLLCTWQLDTEPLWPWFGKDWQFYGMK